MRTIRAVAVLSVTVSVLGTAAATHPASAHPTTVTPARVTRLQATPLSSTAITLSWSRSTTPGFKRTLIRVSTGSHAPATPTSGTRVATAGRSRHAITVRHLTPSTYYRFALFATDGHGHYARRAVVAAPTRSAAVNYLRSYDDGTATTLAWSVPASSFAAVVVRYAKGRTAPAHPWAGHRVQVGAKATSATLPHLAKDTVYTARVWTRDRFGHYSAPATVNFTTDAKPPADGSYHGLITDTAGHPLAGVDVLAIGQSGVIFGSLAEFDTTTRADGTFSLPLPPSAYQIYAGGPNAHGGMSDASGYIAASRVARIVPGHRTSAGTIRLVTGGAVTGRVVDGAGHPLAGVGAYATPIEPYVTGDFGGLFFIVDDFTGLTGTPGDGTYTLKGLPSDAFQVCFETEQAITGGDAGAYAARCRSESTVVTPGKQTALPDTALDAGPAAVITGVVRSSAGARVGQVIVHVTPSQAGDFSTAEAITAADGSFRLGGLAPGSYKVCADPYLAATPSRTGYAASCSGHEVTISESHPGATTVTLGRAGAVTGKVTGRRGVPLAGVTASVLRGDNEVAEGVSDLAGHYTVKNLPAGRYFVCFDTHAATGRGMPTGALADCYRKKTRFQVSLSRVRSGIDAHLATAGAITGTVADSAGNPARGVSVLALPADDEEDGDPAYAMTNDAGRYTITGLAAGTYVVCSDALLTGGPCGRTRTTVRLGKTAHTNLTVPRTGSIVVSVDDGHGDPVPGVDAAAMLPCGPDDDCDSQPVFGKYVEAAVAASAVTRGDGTVALAGLPPGHYAVCLFAYYGTTTAGSPSTGFADSCGDDRFDVAVTAGHQTTVTRTLSPGGAVSGTVTDADGHPIAGVVVHVTHSAAADSGQEAFPGDPKSEPDPANDSVTRADGTFTVRSVRAGKQTVCFDALRATGRNPGGYRSQCLGGAVGSVSGGTPVTVTAAATTSGTNISLANAAGLSGVVRRKSGKPRLGAEVTVLTTDGQVRNFGQTDSHGRYHLGQLAPGTYLVCVEDFDFGAQCYKNVAWNPERGQDVPLAKATKVALTGAQFKTGIDLTLPKG